MVLRLQNGQTGVTVPGYGQRGQCRDLTYKACLRDVLRKLDPIPGIRLANRLLWLQPIEAVCLATQCENGRSSLARPGAPIDYVRAASWSRQDARGTQMSRLWHRL